MASKLLFWFVIVSIALTILNFSFLIQPILAQNAEDDDVITTSTTVKQQIRPKVLVIIFNPIIESEGGQKLVELEGWKDAGSLNQQFKSTIKQASEGFVNYRIQKIIEVDGYPAKSDGFVFTDEEYLECINSGGSAPHCSLFIDYDKLLEDYGVCDMVNKGRISELWLWGGPWFGFYEAIQAGPNPISTNAPPLFGTDCKRTLDIMGFSYERGLAEMLEDFAHRVEGNMDHIYGPRAPDESNPWNKFILLDRDAPGRGGCGTAHNAVNAAPGVEYDRENTRTVLSSCDDFLNYPNLAGVFSEINCTAWNCTADGYLEWWLHHLPRSVGQTEDGKLNNWWSYVVHR